MSYGPIVKQNILSVIHSGSLITMKKEPDAGCFKYTFTGTSSAAGLMSATTGERLNGILERVCFIPGAGGDQPDTLWDFVILDELLVDVLDGGGTDLSNSVSVNLAPTYSDRRATPNFTGNCVALHDKLKLTGSNIGNLKKVTVVLYVRPGKWF